MAKKRQYTNVSELLADVAPDEEFRADFNRRIAQRKVVKHLLALRAVKGLSQKEIAAKIGCTQSRISKLENGTDDGLRLGDLLAYTKALGVDVALAFAERRLNIVEAIKSHAFCIKGLLADLAKLAHTDEKVAEGVATFYGEAFFNLLRILQDSADQLPEKEGQGPYIRIEMGELEILDDGVFTESPAEKKEACEAGS